MSNERGNVRITADLLSRHDRPGPRYTSYPTALEFDAAFGADQYRDRLLRSRAEADEISLYVHLPFCVRRCLYCACHAIIDPSGPDGRVGEPYLGRLLREIELVTAHLGTRRRVTQLHLGGGTPTFYTPAQLERLLDHLERHFVIDTRAERAIELDPRQTTPAHLEMLARRGFNRISIGVQDLDPRVQQAIDRVQPLGLSRALVRRARGLGVEAVNVDLIYGLPHQSADSFRDTVAQVVAELLPDRLAVYSFAYVPWLKGHQKRLPVEALPGGRDKLELLAVASDVLTAAGYRHVGMDHFALPDDALCRARDEGRLARNFMGYTTARAPELVGLGCSAIGHVAGAWVQNIKHLKRYQDAIDAGRLPVERGYALTGDDQLRAHVIGELMCNLVVDKRQVEARFGVDFDLALADARAELERLTDEGLLEPDDGDVLRATELGRLFVRNIAMAFDRYLPARRAVVADARAQRFSRTV